ncbi:MAG: hypothetical protein QOE98_3110 [Gaiellaceae bacterium]|nr:hypothetical protein [Gaiellaceae bacterium]
MADSLTQRPARGAVARRAAVAGLLAGAVAALAACGGEDPGASTVAKATAPAALPSTATATAERHADDGPQVVEPVAGQSSEDALAQQQADELEARTEQQPQAQSGGEPRDTSSAGSGQILSAADRASFAGVAASLGGRSGVAVAGLGLDTSVEAAGTLRSGVAWSTAKVPVAMAAIDAGAAQQPNLTAAITASDNQAALRLWSSLGGGQKAASAANAQLRAAGDARTQVQSQTVAGSGYTPFGQTMWSLSDQARFTAGMACTQAGGQVLGLMGRVVAGQRWGLGSAGVDAQFKGGWGPGTQPGAAGGWLDRQMGVLSIAGRPLAVAIATSPRDNSHATATRNLTAIARWVVEHADTGRLPRQVDC